MRSRLRAVGRIETQGGAVRLRMSVGVHSGRFLTFLAGASHRELVITGPAATETVTMEAIADAGEIVVSPATAALIRPASLGDVKGLGVLLRNAPGGSRNEDPRPIDPTSARVRYVHDAAGALRAAARSNGTAVLLKPVDVGDVLAVAARGERMPRKSTSFGPKPRTGLVLRLFDADA